VSACRVTMKRAGPLRSRSQYDHPACPLGRNATFSGDASAPRVAAMWLRSPLTRSRFERESARFLLAVQEVGK